MKNTDPFASDDEEMPFTDDDSEDENYLASEIALEKWKVREIQRIKLIKDEKHKFDSEQAEIIRRRGLTEEERIAENERLGTDHNERK